MMCDSSLKLENLLRELSSYFILLRTLYSSKFSKELITLRAIMKNIQKVVKVARYQGANPATE